MERRLRSIQTQYDRNYRVQQQMARIERDLNAAQAQGLITGARKNELLALAAARHTQAAASAGTQTTALASLNTQMAATATMARSLLLTLGPIGGLLTVGGLTAGTRSAVGDLSEIGKVADRVGLLTEELQGLRYGFRLSGVEASTFDSSMERLTRTLGEGAAKGNDLSRVFAANGIAIRNAEGQVISTSQALAHMADMMARAQTQSERLALANMAFGRGGMEMANALSRGSEELDRMMAAARQAGAVVDDSVIRRAEELDDRFTKLTTTIGTAFKRAAVEAADAIWGLIDAMGRVDQRTHLPTLERDLRRLEEERDRLQGVMRDMHERASGLRQAAQDYARRQIEATAQEVFKVLDQIAAVQGRISALTTPAARPEGPATVLPPSSSGGGGSTAAARANEYERTTRNIERQIEAMRIQAETIGMTREAAARYRVEQELLNAARRAGISIGPEEQASVRAIADGYAQATAELERMRQQQRMNKEVNDLFRDSVRGLLTETVNGVRQGQTVWESFGNAATNALNRIADKLIEMAVNQLWQAAFPGGLGALGGGGRGGLLGGLLIPGILHQGGVAGVDGYGHGRALPAATWANAERHHNGGVAGLRANEVPAILERGERVIPRNANGGRSEPVDVHVTVGWSRTADGNLLPFVEEVSQRQASSTMERAAPRIVQASVGMARAQILPTMARHQQESGGEYRVG